MSWNQDSARVEPSRIQNPGSEMRRAASGQG